MAHRVNCQVQELYDPNLVDLKGARIQRLLQSGETVEIIVHMQGGQTRHHDKGYILLERLVRHTMHRDVPFVFTPNIPQGYISTTLQPLEGGP